MISNIGPIATIWAPVTATAIANLFLGNAFRIGVTSLFFFVHHRIPHATNAHSMVKSL